MKERKMWNNLCREKRAQEGQKGPNFFLLSLLLSLLKKWSEIHHVPGEKTCKIWASNADYKSSNWRHFTFIMFPDGGFFFNEIIM
jgi:hypothetical protein